MPTTFPAKTGGRWFTIANYLVTERLASRLRQTANVNLYHKTNLYENRQILLNSNYKNCFKLFLSAHFSFWKFLNLNLTFVVCRKRDA